MSNSQEKNKKDEIEKKIEEITCILASLSFVILASSSRT